jgi:hypothetical protein
MTDAERDVGLESESFAATAARWDVAKFGSWLRAGLDSWFHQRATAGRRAVAFRPLLLNPDRDPVAPIVDAVEAIPGALERLRDAGSEALATWTGESTHSGEVLDALLRLAQRLPVPAHVPALRRLLFDGHLNGQLHKDLLALQLLETAMELVALKEGEVLLRELCHAACWQPSFAATWLEGMARANKIDWFEGLQEFRRDLEQVDPTGQELRPMLRRLVNRAGNAHEVAERFESFDLNDKWLVQALFEGERPPIKLSPGRDAYCKNARIIALSTGVDVAPLYDEPNRRGYTDVLLGIYHTYLRWRIPSIQQRRQSHAQAADKGRSLRSMLDRSIADFSPSLLASTLPP